MNGTGTYQYHDALYAECSLSETLYNLTRQPLVQRLREIRLSNIDSLAMPGIANISRYEHCLGTAFLASRVGFARKLTSVENLTLQAAGLLHDSAMQAFGHLVEEALEYVGVRISHEERWKLLIGNLDQDQLGGIDLQIYMGRQSGLLPWAEKAFGASAQNQLTEILDAITGDGRFGSAVCGSVDLDNLDNVTRAAYHMGLEVDRRLPLRIVERMVAIEADHIVFEDDALDLIAEWLDLRSKVYQRFMLSREDFAGKVMLVFATTQSHRNGELTKRDWTLTDREFLQRLLNSSKKDVSDTVKRWCGGELWALSELCWMEGQLAEYEDVLRFSEAISKTIGRTCLAYRIKDKTTQRVRLHFTSGAFKDMGTSSKRWLLGVGSPLRKPFTPSENEQIFAEAATYFHANLSEGSELDRCSEAPSNLPLFANA